MDHNSVVLQEFDIFIKEWNLNINNMRVDTLQSKPINNTSHLFTMSLEDNPTSFFLSANPSLWSFLIGIDLLCGGFNEFLGRTQQPQNSGHHINILYWTPIFMDPN